MNAHLSELTVAVFAAWGLGCILLLLLMLLPSLRGKVRSLWPLMASELVIISVGLLPWQLPQSILGVVLVLAGARIGYEAGHVYGIKVNTSYAYAFSVMLGLFCAAIWLLPQVGWWWLVLPAAIGLALLALPSWRGAALFLFYPVLPFAAFVLCARLEFAGALVLSFLFVELFDSFSLLGGKLAGKHLLAPRISPRKTWEGFALGLAMLLASSVLVAWLLGVSISHLLLVAGLVAVSALTGDLVASAIKRRSGVKDYPAVLPVQGGVLDIVDAWIVAGPLAAACLLLLGST